MCVVSFFLFFSQFFIFTQRPHTLELKVHAYIFLFDLSQVFEKNHHRHASEVTLQCDNTKGKHNDIMLCIKHLKGYTFLKICLMFYSKQHICKGVFINYLFNTRNCGYTTCRYKTQE